MKTAAVCLFLSGSVAAATAELDNLVATSTALVTQIDLGIQYVGAATTASYMEDPIVAEYGIQANAYITSEQATAYNSALAGMTNFQAYTATEFLTDQGNIQLELMEDAIDDFTSVVIDMSTVVQVADMAVEAQQTDDVQKQEELQEFVVDNAEILTIDQGEVDAYNQSLDDVAEHANAAGAYLAVAANVEATDFLDNASIETGNRWTDSVDNLAFDHSNNIVTVDWSNATTYGVYIDGSYNTAIDVLKSNSEILSIGSASDFYLTGPTASNYDCFIGSGENLADCHDGGQ
jgi:hypothetical protein